MGHSCHLCLVVARSVFRVVFAEGHWSVGYRRKRGPGWLRKGSASSPSYATELQIKATRGLFWEMARILRYSERDRKSTRLNSSHPSISYAVFCLKKKK